MINSKSHMVFTKNLIIRLGLAGFVTCTSVSFSLAQGVNLKSGIDTQLLDQTIRPVDDFYAHVSSKWIQQTEMPAEKSRYGTFNIVADSNEKNLKKLIDSLLDVPSAEQKDAEKRKISNLYSSFMDESTVEAKGVTPLAPYLRKIDSVKQNSDLSGLMGEFTPLGFGMPFNAGVRQDAKNPDLTVFNMGQSGLGLPDRDYYLQNDPKLEKIRASYLLYIEKQFRLMGDKNAAQHAQEVLNLETELAKIQWTKVENRDPIKTYNKVSLKELKDLMPGFDWQNYFKSAGANKATEVLAVNQPSYFQALSLLLANQPVEIWKSYFKFHLVKDMSPYLSKDFVDTRFSFYGTELSGIPSQKPRWKRGLMLVEQCMGEALGKQYVAEYFPAEAKSRMDKLVKNLLVAYKQDIENLSWMTPQTKAKALEKLATFKTKIGYPDKWRDYSSLNFERTDLVGKVIAANQFDYRRDLEKIGKPIDRTEWHMSPQTVNAYYSPQWNEIVFPAGILQFPFFNLEADDAVNYGSIGAVIGHEISHGFDDKGSQYDGSGRLLGQPGWFTNEDMKNFKARTQGYVLQYSAYSPVPGFPVNGELTLGENIADNSGLEIAFKAYEISLNGKPSTVIDGLTGEQRFFYGYAQVWREKIRDEEAIMRIKSDPHSPGKFRGRLPLMNSDAFYKAFGVREGDKMYLPPAQRITLW